MEPRGIRNNNPLNIRLSSDKWQGQINATTPNPSFPEGKGTITENISSPRATGAFRESTECAFGPTKGSESSFATEGKGREGVFCQFSTMEYGWRAAFVILCKTYYGKYKLRTIRDIVSRWAPAKENNTAAYIRHVSDYTGIGPDRVLAPPRECPTDWLLIGYAMAVVENGKTLPPIPMLKGFSLALNQ